METYRKFGIKARFRLVNDIVTEEGKKIAGEGGANIADSVVFVGGLLLDFDYDTMCRALKVPDEKFRDKLYKTMRENLTTVREELGEIPPRGEIRRVLIESFEKILGPMQPAGINDELLRKMAQLESYLCSDEFLLRKTPKVSTGVKIREGVELIYGMHKAPGGLIRTAQQVEEDRIKEITISGDFTFLPKEGLERLEGELRMVKRRHQEVVKRVEEFYERNQVESPGVQTQHYVKAMDLE